MKKLMKHILIAATAGTVMTSASNAHRHWLLPSTFTLSGAEQWVTFDGAISNDLFFPNHVPMSLEDISAYAPDGSKVTVENGYEGKFRATFDVKLEQQGTYRVVQDGATYFAQWKEAGEPKRTRASLNWLLKEGIQNKDEVKFLKSSSRVETYVTLGAPSNGAFAASGTGLELVASTHPNDVYVGEDVTFQFTLDGAPAEGVEVTIIKGQDRYRDQDNAVKVKTAADGSFTFNLSEPGRYWFAAAAMAGTLEEQGITMARRVSYNLTIEALAN